MQQLTKKEFKTYYSRWRRLINGNGGTVRIWSETAFHSMYENAHPAVREAITYSQSCTHIPTSRWINSEFSARTLASVNMQLPASHNPAKERIK